MFNKDSEVIYVIENYLNNSVSGNWEELDYSLSGEALAEFKVNSDRVQSKGTITDMEFKVDRLTDEFAQVTADVSMQYGEFHDRIAYDFKLQKTGNGWKIYKMTYGGYLYSKLKEGSDNQKTIDTAKKYMELSFEEKRTTGVNYLAGKLKQQALRSANMPIDESAVNQQAGVQLKVKQVKSLGTAKGYELLSVDYETVIDGNTFPKQAILEVLELEGNWKIGNIEISR